MTSPDPALGCPDCASPAFGRPAPREFGEPDVRRCVQCGAVYGRPAPMGERVQVWVIMITLLLAGLAVGWIAAMALRGQQWVIGAICLAFAAGLFVAGLRVVAICATDTRMSTRSVRGFDVQPPHPPTDPGPTQSSPLNVRPHRGQ